MNKKINCITLGRKYKADKEAKKREHCLPKANKRQKAAIVLSLWSTIVEYKISSSEVVVLSFSVHQVEHKGSSQREAKVKLRAYEWLTITRVLMELLKSNTEYCEDNKKSILLIFFGAYMNA